MARRILHCPENIGNQAKRLSDQEKAAGLTSHCVTIRPDPFGFTPDRVISSREGIFSLEMARWRLFFVALFGYSEICFNAGKSLMPQRMPADIVRARVGLLAPLYRLYAWTFEGFDIWLFSLLGKRMQMIFQGTDARFSTHYTVRLNAAELSGFMGDHVNAKADAYKARRIATARKFMDRIWCLNPDLLENFSGDAEFMPYQNVDIAATPTHSVFTQSDALVVHAPSRRDVKGSTFVIAAFEALASEFPRVSFEVIEGVPNEHAKALYDRADLVVDQLLVGWFGGVAVEAMSRGVPVVARLDFSQEFSSTPYFAELPIVDARSDTIEAVLRDLLNRPSSELQSLGRASRKFVETYHDGFDMAAGLTVTDQ